MIEIILRKDIKEYEPKPLFGFSYRQVLTALAIAAAGAGLGVGLTAAGVPGTIMQACVLLVCAGIGFVGLGQVQGLKFELWLRIWREDRSWPRECLFSAPRLSPASERSAARRARRSRRERRADRADAAAARAESELCEFF